ncbi:MAG: SDR family NAD(P)-dependent oxidoreductase [Thermoguttaceae bacterium]
MSDKVALITGSGKRRIGNVVAEALAMRGCNIALHYNRSADDARHSAAQLEKLGVRVEAFQADISRENEVHRLFDQVLKSFGRLDVLVTAAAVWQSRELEQSTADDVLRHFEINTLGTFLCCQSAGKIMVAQPSGGVIITIGDWACERPYPHYAAYLSSKGAIPAITRTFAVELARRNTAVRVNCILPGPVMVPEELDEHELKGAIAGTLLKRLGRPENIAQAVFALVENDYITGVCLPVDGGRTIAGI